MITNLHLHLMHKEELGIEHLFEPSEVAFSLREKKQNFIRLSGFGILAP